MLTHKRTMWTLTRSTGRAGRSLGTSVMTARPSLYDTLGWVVDR